MYQINHQINHLNLRRRNQTPDRRNFTINNKHNFINNNHYNYMPIKLAEKNNNSPLNNIRNQNIDYQNNYIHYNHNLNNIKNPNNYIQNNIHTYKFNNNDHQNIFFNKKNNIQYKNNNPNYKQNITNIHNIKKNQPMVITKDFDMIDNNNYQNKINKKNNNEINNKMNRSYSVSIDEYKKMEKMLNEQEENLVKKILENSNLENDLENTKKQYKELQNQFKYIEDSESKLLNCEILINSQIEENTKLEKENNNLKKQLEEFKKKEKEEKKKTN